jgi:voltage-gated potassium channel
MEARSRGRLGSRLDRSVAKAVTRRRIFPYLAGATLVLALGSGFVMILADRSNFPNYGVAVWWAIVTLATVGYGDVVPTTPLGRIFGSAVIILGVTFLAFLTATVTSLFVSSDQEAARERELEHREAADRELQELLKRLEERLSAIESKLERD